MTKSQYNRNGSTRGFEARERGSIWDAETVNMSKTLADIQEMIVRPGVLSRCQAYSYRSWCQRNTLVSIRESLELWKTKKSYRSASL